LTESWRKGGGGGEEANRGLTIAKVPSGIATTFQGKGRYSKRRQHVDGGCRPDSKKVKRVVTGGTDVMLMQQFLAQGRSQKKEKSTGGQRSTGKNKTAKCGRGETLYFLRATKTVNKARS